MKKFGIVALLVLSMAFSGFAATKDWTVMVFLNADNNLERFGIADLNEMETIGSNENLNILVQLDRCEGYDTSNGNWEGTKRFYVTKDSTSNIASKELMDMGEVDMGDWKEAADFFKWGAKNYPADRYLFVYWNHGAGWVKEGNETQVVKGISYDDESGNHIDSVGMKKAADAMAAAIGRKVAITAFDACLMGMVEIQAQLEDSVDVLIASEETEPGDGWDYISAMGAIAGNPKGSTASIATEITKGYMESYAGASSWWGPTACTQAASDLSKAVYIQEAVDALAEAIIENDEYSAFNAARGQAQKYAYAFYKDLVHVAQLIKENASNYSVKVRCDEVIEAVNDSVIYSDWQADKMKNSNGLAIYLPMSNEYKDHYVYTEFAKLTAWDELLEKSFSREDAQKAVDSFYAAIGTEKEEAHAKHIIRSIELGDEDLLNKVNEAAQENPKGYEALMQLVNEVVAAK